MSKEEQEEFLAVDDCNNNKEYKFWDVVELYENKDHDMNEDRDSPRKQKMKVQEKWTLEYYEEYYVPYFS